MATYTYFEVDADGSAPMFDFADFPTDDEARRHALNVLRRAPQRSAVEVWRDRELVGRTPNGDTTEGLPHSVG